MKMLDFSLDLQLFSDTSWSNIVRETIIVPGRYMADITEKTSHKSTPTMNTFGMCAPLFQAISALYDGRSFFLHLSGTLGTGTLLPLDVCETL